MIIKIYLTLMTLLAVLSIIGAAIHTLIPGCIFASLAVVGVIVHIWTD